MKLYLKYFKVHFKSELEYKASFILSFLSQFLTVFGYYFTILCLFDKFSNIKGFNVYHVLLTFSIVQFGITFCEVFFRGIDLFDDLIVSGNFDRLLLRPRNIILQVCCDRMSLVRLARLIESVVILFVAIINLNIVWDLRKIMTVTFMLIGSVFLFFSILIVAAAYCFFTIKGLEVRNILTDGCKHMAQYPIGIYKKGIVMFLTFIVPFGLINYYPLMFIIGKSSSDLYMFLPLATILYLIPAIALFYKGVKRYNSVGS